MLGTQHVRVGTLCIAKTIRLEFCEPDYPGLIQQLVSELSDESYGKRNHPVWARLERTLPDHKSSGPRDVLSKRRTTSDVGDGCQRRQ